MIKEYELEQQNLEISALEKSLKKPKQAFRESSIARTRRNEKLIEIKKRKELIVDSIKKLVNTIETKSVSNKSVEAYENNN